MTENEFITWLNEKLKELGWSDTELARRMKVAPSSVNMVLNGVRSPTLNFCVKLARAISMPQYRVLELAGHSSTMPTAENENELLSLYRLLDNENKEILIEIAKVLAARGK